jgi:hypothetical protein
MQLLGQKRSLSAMMPGCSDDAWVVAGGPILITSLVGNIVTAYDGALTHTWWCDATTAAQDVEFTDSVDIDAYLIGETIVFSNG